jgi:tetratricopeptide (TPR) repeat protein
MATPTAHPALDPDALVALEEQRDFLLASLRDLDAEYAAGDLDDHDYRELRDDYTARAAAVLRALDERAARHRAAHRPTDWRRILLVTAAVVAVALVAGVLVRDNAGRRDPGQEITGGGPNSTRTLMARADSLLFGGDPAEALELYEQVLSGAPTNVEALLNQATASVMVGDPQAAVISYDRVLELDPDNVEAMAYQASLFHRLGDTARALERLEAVNEQDPTYVDAWSLRVAVLDDAGRLDEGLSLLEAMAAAGDDDIAFAVVQQATGVLRAVGSGLSPVDELRLYDAVLAGAPDNALVLAYRAWQPVTLVMNGAIVGDDADEVLAQSLASLDRAVDLDGGLPDARAFRTVVLARLGRDGEAAAELRAFDATDPPQEMRAIIEASGLRDRLGVAGP